MKTYDLGFSSYNMTVFHIGREDEWEVASGSRVLSENLQAKDDKDAIKKAKIFFDDWEKGSETFDIENGHHFERVDIHISLLTPEGRKIEFSYYSIFEGLKEIIRMNLRKAKEENLKRLIKKKEEIERQIKDQESKAIPTPFYKN